MRRAGAVVGARTIAMSWAILIFLRSGPSVAADSLLSLLEMVNSDTLDLASDRLLNV